MQPKPEPKHAHPHRTPRQEWRGTSGARTQADTHPNTQASSGAAQSNPKPKHTNPHRTTQAGVAGYKQSAHTSRNTPEHSRQEWRGAAETRAQADTPKPHTPARSGGVQAERAHERTHTPTPQPGVAGRSSNLSPSTHTHAAQPSQEGRGTSGACTSTPQHPCQK